MNIEPDLTFVENLGIDVPLAFHCPDWVNHCLNFRDVFLGDEGPMFLLAVTINLSYDWIEKLSFVRLLHGLMELYDVLVSLGWVSNRIINLLLSRVIFFHHYIIEVILFCGLSRETVLGLLVYYVHVLPWLGYEPWKYSGSILLLILSQPWFLFFDWDPLFVYLGCLKDLKIFLWL